MLTRMEKNPSLSLYRQASFFAYAMYDHGPTHEGTFTSDDKQEREEKRNALLPSFLVVRIPLILQCRRTAHDIEQFACDRLLTRLIVQDSQFVDQLVSVIRSDLHSHNTCAMLRSVRV